METKIKMLIVDADRTITSEIDQRLAKLGFKNRCNALPDTSINKDPNATDNPCQLFGHPFPCLFQPVAYTK